MCLEQSERGKEMEEGRGHKGGGEVIKGLVGCGEDLGFYPRAGGSPEGL